MKASRYAEHGPPDALWLKEVEKPPANRNEVPIRMCATPVTEGDCGMRSLRFPLFLSLPMRPNVGIRRSAN